MYKKYTNKEILSVIDHRPWKLPEKPWVYYQEWNTPIFLHWAVDAKELERLLPQELELDVHENKAWISLVPFQIKIKPRFLPSFPLLSSFDEVNLRTYVKYRGKSGVYFLNIEAGKRVSAWLARKLSGLPYIYASMKHEKEFFTSENNRQKNRIKLNYQINELITNPSKTDLWLSERYALFTVKNNKVTTYDVHHMPWKLHRLSLREIHVDYPAYKHLMQGAPSLTHYAHGVQVLCF